MTSPDRAIEPSAARRRPHRAPYRLVVSVAAAVAVLNGASTVWAISHVASAVPSAPRAPGWVTLARIQNGGAAFGFGAGNPLLVLAASVAGLTVLLAWPRWATGRLELVAVGVMLGGAFANVADRLVAGSVTDWIHLAGYPPTFNPADICLRVGAVVALLTRLPVRTLAGKTKDRIVGGGRRRREPLSLDPGRTLRRTPLKMSPARAAATTRNNRAAPRPGRPP